ncbi:LysR family transcriptional regulator [Pararhizobium mangrovi]|uniref:LysR family transcriptional regulator n=1 Tax=Pararhizobium mangrovi TaxID=2590452 RepID=A0A506U4F5_9HYPH|nr:LysR family transcriptional regulator [Pararhizobium mangrovi]TPW28690.1 LysR family transcriptional regulator [Pararhizobium mangrovi]
MKTLNKRLPPLNALVAFEAVMRTGTVTAAARELGTSQPAVSQRLRTLEEALGTTLFHRAGRSLKASDAARRYASEIAEALEAIAAASETAKGTVRARAPLVISAPFGFTHLWLAPLLPRLETAFPQIDIVARAEDAPHAAGQRKPDLDVRFGEMTGPAASAYFLMHEVAQPVCSPDFATRHALSGTATPARRLADLPLLHLDEEDPRWCNWPAWFAANGVGDFHATPRLFYNNYPLIEQAAAEGKGIALCWRGIVEPMLDAERLVTAGPVFFRRDWGYWLHVATPSDTRGRAVALWIRDAARNDSDRVLARCGLAVSG